MTETRTDRTALSLAEATDLGFEIPAQVVAAPRLTQRHPALYPWAVRTHRVRRRIQWLRSGTAWATERRTTTLPVRVKKHASLLMRELTEDEMVLQRNKVVNLRLAGERVDGIVIRPGESFSFNKAVGNCTRRKGYVEGMRLSNGAAVPGVGGGICQLANLLHWMFLHSPLTVVERSEHSFDPFPDKGRVLPWGVGCSIVYNYVDLVVRNDTEHTFQLKTWVDERHLRGELLADELPTSSYKVEARNEAFLRHHGEIFRKNEIWRTVISRRTGNVTGEELLKKNCALVKYEPADGTVIELLT
ncbi:VanW family protein [Nocardioides jensenii]|uniref:VanW family protein n=1 Tax=Nocardioides jensenii TaxID=1843 RepID=UPI0009E8167F|nr:VanW family protein [Nocardioides jensenii]